MAANNQIQGICCPLLTSVGSASIWTQNHTHKMRTNLQEIMVPFGLHWHWTWDPPSSTLLVLGFQACDAVFKVYTVLKITPSNQHCGPSHCIMGRRVHLTSKSYSLPRVEGEKCTGGTKEGTRRGYKIYTPGLYIKKINRSAIQSTSMLSNSLLPHSKFPTLQTDQSFTDYSSKRERRNTN